MLTWIGASKGRRFWIQKLWRTHGSLMVRRTCNLRTWHDFIEGLLGLNQPNISPLRVFRLMCFRHVPEQARKKLDDWSEVLVLIGYHSIGAYKLYSPIEDELVSKKDFLVDKSKGLELESKNHLHNCVRRKEQNEASTGQDEEVFELKERRSKGTRTEFD